MIMREIWLLSLPVYFIRQDFHDIYLIVYVLEIAIKSMTSYSSWENIQRMHYWDWEKPIFMRRISYITNLLRQHNIIRKTGAITRL